MESEVQGKVLQSKAGLGFRVWGAGGAGGGGGGGVQSVVWGLRLGVKGFGVESLGQDQDLGFLSILESTA